MDYPMAEHSPITMLILVVCGIVIIYSIGLWAGRQLERHIVADHAKYVAKRKEEEAKEKRRNRRR